MSETMMVPPLGEQPAAKRTPTVYFIDDSATMREVIKIAFRRENINIVACGDAASALAQFEQNRPDVVITDVIMPDQDGYSVCSHIKQNPELSAIPVVLMSGVVNKSVAEKAMSVKADELIRKPFQPLELIARVKSLLQPAGLIASERGKAATSLNNLFAPVSVPRPVAAVTAPNPQGAWPSALAQAMNPSVPARPPAAQAGGLAGGLAAATANSARPSAESVKLRSEIARIELLVKKLQTELALERQYNQSLEQQIKTLLDLS